VGIPHLRLCSDRSSTDRGGRCRDNGSARHPGRLSTALLGVTTVKDDLNAVLTQIPIQAKLWGLPIMELETEAPPHDQTSWWIWRALTLRMGLPQVERTVTQKLLHRKRPQLFPMLDSPTSPHLVSVRKCRLLQ
jgi:uncharacterized protein DUF6308